MAAPIVVILAAGQGTRMRSSIPKVLHELCGRPMLLWPVHAALQAGAERVVVVDSPQRSLAHVLPEGVELAVQPAPNGTGGAVLAALAYLEGSGAAQASASEPGPKSKPSPKAKAKAKGKAKAGAGAGARADAPVVVLSGDVPLVGADTVADLLDVHAESGAAATMLTGIVDDPSGYGRVLRDAGGAVERVIETKADADATPEQRQIKEVNIGIFAFRAGVLEELLPRLTPDNAQGELYLPQVLDLLRAERLSVIAHTVADPGLLLNINDLVVLARVRRLAQQAINERHMRAGVGIVDPDATVIDVDVQIGADTVIEPFSSIRGSTRIGRGCTVKHSYLIDCVLEDGASVGPFAYLRPGTLLHAGAKVGTFVEVKNSSIGEAAKVPHLSYIGDADVGERTNLGAGTVTANYDGREKHATRIGKRVRGGVNTSLVAPITVGDDAYTAAGSVVTEDVPAGALAVARAKQQNVEGYTERQERPLDSKET